MKLEGSNHRTVASRRGEGVQSEVHCIVKGKQMDRFGERKLREIKERRNQLGARHTKSSFLVLLLFF